MLGTVWRKKLCRLSRTSKESRTPVMLGDGRVGERMLWLHEKLAGAKISQEKTVIQRYIEAAAQEIDQLV